MGSGAQGTLAERRGHRLVGGAGLAISAIGLLVFTREAISSHMRYAIGLGAVLLFAGALFVWFRGAPREVEALGDGLDTRETEEPIFEVA